MSSTIKGAVIAAVAIYLWGFLYWGASPFPYMAWHETPDDKAAGQALLAHFPDSGVYYVPGNGNPPEERAALYDTGPTGFVILDRDGRPEFEPIIMGQGFALNLVVAFLMATLLQMLAPALPAYGDRFKAGVLVGLIAVVFVDLGRGVWWLIPWPWVFAQSFYDLTALILMSAILARRAP